VTVYVLDAESVAMLPSRALPPHRNTVLNAVTDAVNSGAAVFPPEVAKEARRLADDEPWVHALGSACGAPSIPHSFVLQALAGCPDLADLDAEYSVFEPSASYVAGMALNRIASGVVVVTEELDPLPDRAGLGEACSKLSLPMCTLPGFVDTLPGCTSAMVGPRA
jgi:hypothetical protein